jgi:asparagine synthase (glutamine-hydrolysing)
MLHYFDRASMAHSLEVRVPFLDHELVEFCARIPPGLKVHRLTTKHILKHAARDLLPGNIVHKRKIGFFHGTVSTWLDREADRAIETYLRDPGARYRELVDERAIEPLLSGGGRSSHLLLSVLMLEVWLSTYLPRSIAGGAGAHTRGGLELEPAAYAC